MQSNPYGSYVYPNPGTVPVRYMVPTGYRQNSPPFANQAFDRYAPMQTAVRLPPQMMQPLRYPPGYRPTYPPNAMPMQPSPIQTPIGTSPQPRPNEQLQPPSPYYYNPHGPNGASPTASQPPKKGAKEFKESAFTIAPDGSHNEPIKGLVSNHDINDLLKHKGTKVKIAKIYRITKTKHDAKAEIESDEDLPPLPTTNDEPPRQQQPTPVIKTERPVSSSSSGSHCSTCSNCSCSECRHSRRSHVYDDCPECRAEWSRERSRRNRRK